MIDQTKHLVFVEYFTKNCTTFTFLTFDMNGQSGSGTLLPLPDPLSASTKIFRFHRFRFRLPLPRPWSKRMEPTSSLILRDYPNFRYLFDFAFSPPLNETFFEKIFVLILADSASKQPIIIISIMQMKNC